MSSRHSVSGPPGLGVQGGQSPGSEVWPAPRRSGLLDAIRAAGPGRAALLALLWSAALAATLAGLSRTSSVSLTVGPTAGFILSALAAAATVAILSGDEKAAPGMRLASRGLILLAGYLSAITVSADLRGTPVGPDGYAVGALILLLVPMAVALPGAHKYVRQDLTEAGSDILLVTVVIGSWVYLLLSSGHAANGSAARVSLTFAVGTAAVLVFAAWTLLALWSPSRMNMSFLAAATLVSAAAIAVAFGRQFEPQQSVPPSAQVLVLVALAALAAVVVGEPHLARRAGSADVGRASRTRPWLLVLSLVGTCVFLGGEAVTPDAHPNTESIVLIAVVAGIVGLRTLGNQRSMAETNHRLHRALGEREAALHEREAAVSSLRTAIGELAESEQRLRGLLDAAVDGIVEIGAGDVILRANDAFRSMLGLEHQDVIGKTWEEIAEIAGAAKPLATLRVTGHAVLPSQGRSMNLEARSSTVPTDPPGTLLLVRDVTANKVAEQTIRTLFQFLQDRDEDRTRYLRRTNLAIESERNRIARDLHDGPIQGVAAASLSLEATKLMVESGQYERASSMLGAIRDELREETHNLRRLMSDLRPPLLEERGLIAAVRDLCAKFEETTGVRVRVSGSNDEPVPGDVETIAYRVIQEALSNVKKHALARSASVRIEGRKGSLEVEVQDDGSGFDASETREYLRNGKVGLASMRERTELGSGTFTLRTRPGAGTSVTATIPFDLLAQLRS